MSKPATNPNTHCVVYRTGGTANFKWNRTVAMTREQATEKRIEIERMGYKAMTVNYTQSVNIGLPETYE